MVHLRDRPDLNSLLRCSLACRVGLFPGVPRAKLTSDRHPDEAGEASSKAKLESKGSGLAFKEIQMRGRAVWFGSKYLLNGACRFKTAGALGWGDLRPGKNRQGKETSLGSNDILESWTNQLHIHTNAPLLHNG